jgi:hypothetical protein
LTLESQTTPELQKLKDRVDELEKEVARLKKQLADRPYYYSITPRPEYAVPGPYSKPAPVEPELPIPRGSEKRQFNGLPFYVVPLGKAQTALSPTVQNSAQTGVVSPIEVLPRGVIKAYRPAEIDAPESLNPSK